jgi:hypothetical protein
MRKSQVTQALLLVSLLIACLAVFAAVKSEKTQTSAQDSRREIEAVRRGGLREAARITGKYVARVNASTWIKYDLEGLAKNSYAIVIGTPLEHSSQLTDDGTSIVTEYELKINEVLKGNLYQTQTTRVQLPGGKVVFEDGSSAEIQTADLRGMEEGKTYVLFLRSIEASPNVFALTGLGQGLFELSSEKTVRPHGNKADSVQKHSNTSVTDFLQLIRDAAKKYPSPAEDCCS